MESHKAIRQQAWNRLFKERWFWRLFGVAFLLGLCAQAISVVVQGILGRLGAETPFTLMERALAERALPELTESMIFQLANSAVLIGLMMFLLGGLASFGFATALLKFVRGSDERLFADAFGGYRRPLEMMALEIVHWAVVAFWTLLLIVPGIVAFYRYRYVWLLKAENPDWSAVRCMHECAALTDGAKSRMFAFDCSYWGIVTVWLSIPLAMTVLIAVTACLKASVALLAAVTLLLVAGYALCLALGVVTTYYIAAGQALFYNQLKNERKEKDK